MLKTLLGGVDLCAIPSIGESNAVAFISEVGTDMGKWKSGKHFAAWLNVAPNTKITGGKVINCRMEKKKNHAGQILRLAASTLTRNKSPLGDYARKMRARLGKRSGKVAVAHKLALIIYSMLKNGEPFDENRMKIQKEHLRLKKIKFLEKQLEKLKNAA